MQPSLTSHQVYLGESDAYAYVEYGVGGSRTRQCTTRIACMHSAHYLHFSRAWRSACCTWAARLALEIRDCSYVRARSGRSHNAAPLPSSRNSELSTGPQVYEARTEAGVAGPSPTRPCLPRRSERVVSAFPSCAVRPTCHDTVPAGSGSPATASRATLCSRRRQSAAATPAPAAVTAPGCASVPARRARARSWRRALARTASAGLSSAATSAAGARRAVKYAAAAVTFPNSSQLALGLVLAGWGYPKVNIIY